MATLGWDILASESLRAMARKYSSSTAQFSMSGMHTNLSLHSMLCRSEKKAEDAIKQLKNDIPAAEIEFINFDLASISSCRKAADAFLAKENRLDILLNNAGIVSWVGGGG